MPPYRLTDPEMFIGIDQQSGGRDQSNLYLSVWKLESKDVPNPNRLSFKVQKITVGRVRPVGGPPDHYDGLEIFNGEIKGPDIDRLCIDLQYRRLRVNLDGYSYHEAKLGQQMGSTRTPATQDISKFMRLNDLFDWKDYVDAGTMTFKPEPSQTTWNRRSQTRRSRILVNYEKLDKDLKELRDKLVAKQTELDGLQRKFDAAEQKYNDYRSNFKLGRPIPPSLFVYDGRITESFPVLRYTWLFKGREPVTIIDGEWPPLTSTIKVKYTGDFDTTGWRAIVLQGNEGRKVAVAIYDGTRYFESYTNLPLPNATHFFFANSWGAIDLQHYGTRYAVLI